MEYDAKRRAVGRKAEILYCRPQVKTHTANPRYANIPKRLRKSGLFPERCTVT